VTPDMASKPAGQERTVTAVTFVVLALTGCLITLAMRPWDFVHHDTTEAVMWAQAPWTFGFWKHPPMLPWLLKLWFVVLPIHPVSVAAFTGLNMAVGAWAVWRIARLTLDDRSAFLALALLGLLPFASVMGIKLNHNTILISLWPLTALALLRALERPTWLSGVLFGIACAAALLAKYYSGLLLVACLLAALVSPARRRFFTAPAPYVAVATFAALIAPHAIWVLNHPAQPLGYAFAATHNGRALALNFAWTTALLCLPVAIAGLALARSGRGKARLDAVVSRRRLEAELITLTAVPYLLTVGLTLAFNLRGATAWAMPVFMLLPVIIAARMAPPSDLLVRNARWLFFVAAAVICLVGPLAARHGVTTGRDGASDPRRPIAEAVTRMWRRNIGTKLPFIGGDNRLLSATTLFSSDHPLGWTGFNRRMAPWVRADAAATRGFAAVCLLADAECRASVARAVTQTVSETGPQTGLSRSFTCKIRHRVEYLWAAGPWVEVEVTVVPPRNHAALIGTAPCFGENLIVEPA
jgi:hypothetical protein